MVDQKPRAVFGLQYEAKIGNVFCERLKPEEIASAAVPFEGIRGGFGVYGTELAPVFAPRENLNGRLAAQTVVINGKAGFIGKVAYLQINVANER